jgi:hypothetical protein
MCPGKLFDCCFECVAAYGVCQIEVIGACVRKTYTVKVLDNTIFTNSRGDFLECQYRWNIQ